MNGKCQGVIRNYLIPGDFTNSRTCRYYVEIIQCCYKVVLMQSLQEADLLAMQKVAGMVCVGNPITCLAKIPFRRSAKFAPGARPAVRGSGWFLGYGKEKTFTAHAMREALVTDARVLRHGRDAPGGVQR